MKVIFRNYITHLYQELDSLHTDDEWKHICIVLFGMNPPSEIIYDYFKTKNIPIYSIIDNNKSKHGKKYDSCCITSPEETLTDFKKNVLVIIASSAYDEMKKQIFKMGYSEKNVYVIKNFFYKPQSLESFPIPPEYNYNVLSLEEIQYECLQMLKYIKNFCEKRNIKYFLSDGTLLGAVRHKGFIPWDDDIDISMPWNDYVRFCQEFEDTEEYELNSMLCSNAYDIPCDSVITRVMHKHIVTERAYFPIYSRQGICVDIFPLNGYPDTPEERKRYEDELGSLCLQWMKHVRNKLNTNQYSREKHSKLWRQMIQVMTRYNYNDSNYVGGVSCSLFNHSIAPKNMYESPSVILFENEEFMSPKNPDYVLTQAYGDYMLLPPIEKRTLKHFFNTYRLTKKS